MFREWGSRDKEEGTMHPQVLSASTMMGDDVINTEGENLGSIKELMIDLEEGRIAYAVLSFGGFLGLGDKLFAIPWGAFALDTEREAFILNVDRDVLEDAPGFDEDNWPQTKDRDYVTEVYDYYDYEPYW
jgi:sporulation protein YlmC with PRC-barrel domain